MEEKTSKFSLLQSSNKICLFVFDSFSKTLSQAGLSFTSFLLLMYLCEECVCVCVLERERERERVCVFCVRSMIVIEADERS